MCVSCQVCALYITSFRDVACGGGAGSFELDGGVRDQLLDDVESIQRIATVRACCVEPRTQASHGQ